MGKVLKFRAFDPSKPQEGFIYYDLVFLATMMGGMPDSPIMGVMDVVRKAMDIQRLFQRRLPTAQMVCTEMKDSSGIEIYEGDIIKAGDGITGNIIRGAGGFFIGVDELPLSAFKPVELKIIGNICQDEKILIKHDRENP